jgi:hypothetical protein
MTQAFITPVLAAATDELPKGGIDLGFKNSLNGAIPVIIAALLVLFAFVLWAAFLRRSERRRQRGEIIEGPLPSRGSRSSGSGSGKRRRREKGRPRNPTLAETGGLPPIRDPNAPPPNF